MANPLDSIVNVTISVTGAAVPTAKGFGIPLIMDLKSGSYSGNSLEISEESSLLSYGFLTTDAEYLAAKSIFAQNPKPEKAVMGKISGYAQKYKVELTPLTGVISYTKKYNYSVRPGGGSAVSIESQIIPDNSFLLSTNLTATPTINGLTILVSVNGAGAVTAIFTADTIADAQIQLDGLAGVTAAIVETDKIKLTATTAGQTLLVTGGTAISVFNFPTVITEVSNAAKVSQAVEVLQGSIEGSLRSRHLSVAPNINGLTLLVSVGGAAAVTATFVADTIADAQAKLGALTGVTASIVDTDQIKLTSTDATKSIEITSGTASHIFNFPSGAITAKSTLTSYITLTDDSTKLSMEVTSQGGIFGFSKGNLDFDLLEVTTAPGASVIANSFASIRNENDSWYAIIVPYAAKQIATPGGDLASVVDTNERIALFSTLDDEVLKDTLNNVAEDLYDANKGRFCAFFHHDMTEMPHAALSGKVLPTDPGAATWAYKTLTGVTAEGYTTDEFTKLNNNNVNRYVSIAGVSHTQFGFVSQSGFFVDVVRDRDFLKSRMQENIFKQLTTLQKIPYTNQGVAVVENEVRAVLRLGVAQGILSADPAPQVTVPDVNNSSQVTPANKSARLLPNVKFSATLAGAIHKVTINGTISV